MWSRGRGSLSGPTEDAQVTTLVLKLLQLSSGLNVSLSLWEFDPFREEARRIVQGR